MENNWYFTTNKEQLDVDKIHQYISEVSYWGRGRTKKEVEQTIEHSLCFGLFDWGSKEQLAFARVVTDQVLFGYIMDVIVFEGHQGRGLGKLLISYIMDHEIVARLKTVALKTKDAQQLYERYGFNSVGDSELWMANDKVKLL